MIRVLHTIDTTGPGGAEAAFVRLATGLDPQVFVSHAAIPGPGWVDDTLRAGGLEPLQVPSRGGFNVSYLAALVRIVRRHRIDVVQAHLLGTNLYASLAGLLSRVAVVSTFHGFVDSSLKDGLLPVKRRLIDHGSRRVVFVSDRLQDYFCDRHGFSRAKATTVYNGVHTTHFRPRQDSSLRRELGLGPEHYLVGAIGNIRPAKGYEHFLRAARLVVENHPDCRFVIAGEGGGEPLRRLLQLRASLGLDRFVYFLGFRPQTEPILNNLDLFVLASTSEGFSIATIEAMACAVPVVATRSGGPEEIIRHGETGLLVAPGSAEALARGIEMIRREPAAARRFGAAGRRLVEGRFSAAAMVTRYQGIYQDLATAKCGQPGDRDRVRDAGIAGGFQGGRKD